MTKITKEALQTFIETKLEPLLTDYIVDELIVFYDNAKGVYIPVSVESKTLKAPSLFGGDIVELLFHKAPLYKAGIVKKREPFFVRLECKFWGFKFFLDFKLKQTEGEAT